MYKRRHDSLTQCCFAGWSAVSQVGQDTAIIGDVFERDGRNLAGGFIKKVLVLRVVASDEETTATEEKLADDIFGASGDAVNLQSQYKACSNDKLQFNAVESNTEVGGDSNYNSAPMWPAALNACVPSQ